jgi:hypothetical protein
MPRSPDFVYHEGPSAAEPQPKPKQTVHHEGREEHEVRKLKGNNFRILRGLRALRGDMIFTHSFKQFGVDEKFARTSKISKDNSTKVTKF